MVRRPPPPRVSVWDRLAAAASPSGYVPILRSDLTWARMTTRHGRPSVMLADRPRRYLRIGERDDYLIQRMDGSRSVADLVVEYFDKYGTFGFQAVVNIVTILRNAGFLTDPPRDVWQELQTRLAGDPGPVRQSWHEGTLTRLKIPIRGVDGFFTAYHRKVGRYFFGWPFLLLSVLLSAGGLVAFAAEVIHGRDPFAPVAGSSLAAIVVLVVAYYSVIFIHESAHALTCKHFGGIVPKGGFLLYYLMPAFYVDVTDAWLQPWRRRIAIFWAGPYSGFTIAGAASLVVWLAPHGLAANILFKLAVAAYLTNAMNLMPLMLLDGYWILEQWLEIPQLRDRALEFVRGPLWGRLFERRRLTGRETFFAVFGILSAVYTVFTAGLAVVLWRARLSPLLTPLWRTPGLLPKAITVLVIVVVGTPLAIRYTRKGWQLLRAAARAPGAALHAIAAVRIQDRLRLLRTVGFLRTLPAATIDRLARSARTRLATPGEVIVRQGDPGHEFFVVAAGHAEVTVSEGGVERTATQLKPGDFFGERALLGTGVRTASVHAVTPLRLLVFGEDAFWAELAGPVAWQARVRQALNERALLARVPLFSDLTSRKLDLLAVSMAVTDCRPGQTVVRKGQPGSDFYVVRSGTFRVMDGRRQLAQLGPGDYFGEIALLRDVPRTATVIAASAGSLWRLDRSGFEELLGRYLELEDEFERVATVRGHSMEGAA